MDSSKHVINLTWQSVEAIRVVVLSFFIKFLHVNLCIFLIRRFAEAEDSEFSSSNIEAMEDCL